MVEQAPETDEDSAERGGIYLLAFAAFALPALIVLAAFLPASPVSISERGVTRTLDSIELDQSTIPLPNSATTPQLCNPACPPDQRSTSADTEDPDQDAVSYTTSDAADE